MMEVINNENAENINASRATRKKLFFFDEFGEGFLMDVLDN